MGKPKERKLDPYELALKEISKNNADVKQVTSLLEKSLKRMFLLRAWGGVGNPLFILIFYAVGV